MMNPKPKSDRYAYLRQEAMAPYRGLRRFIYLGIMASGGIGAFIFLMQAIAGREVSQAIGNLGIQVGVIALMIVLFRIDRDKSERSPTQK